jgi:hypothetical protein
MTPVLLLRRWRAGAVPDHSNPSLSPKRIWRAGGEGQGEGRLFARMPPRTWLLEVGVGLRASGRPSPSAGENAGLCPLPRRGGGEGNRAYPLPFRERRCAPTSPLPPATFPSPPSAFRARGERVRVRGGYWLECRQELGSWRWALACEPAAAPHPRPARTPASALSPEGAGERGTVRTRCHSASGAALPHPHCRRRPFPLPQAHFARGGRGSG